MSQAKRLTVFLLLLLSTQSWGADFPPKHHPWGRFKPGSWARVRQTIRTVDANGDESTRVRTITTRLDKAERDGVTLTREVKNGETVEGPTTTKFTWDGRPAKAKLSEKLSVGEYQLQGKTIFVMRQNLSATLDGTTTNIKRWYSPDQPPFILKELVETVGPKGRTHSAMQVERLQVRRKVLGRDMVCVQAATKTVARGRRMSATSYHNVQVPGGLVYSESETRDDTQAQVETTRTVLDAFEAAK